MKKLLLKIGALAALNVALGLLFLVVFDGHRTYAPWETDAILPVMGKDRAYSAVVLGSSHAYILSRIEANHPHLEAAVGGPVLNMALPTGGGVWPAKIYLEQFVARGNSAKELIYVIEPFVFFNEAANKAHKFVYFEPFQPSFLARLVTEGYPPRRILTYVRSKFTWEYLNQQPLLMGAFESGLRPEQVSEAGIADRMRTLYLEGLEEATFNRYREKFEAILMLAQQEGMAVRLVTPPTLIGHEPGQPTLEKALQALKSAYSFDYIDLTNAMADPNGYYNLDHMSTPGVAYFCAELLAPFLAEARTAEAKK